MTQVRWISDFVHITAPFVFQKLFFRSEVV